jgi:hypothetical protein
MSAKPNLCSATILPVLRALGIIKKDIYERTYQKNRFN